MSTRASATSSARAPRPTPRSPARQRLIVAGVLVVFILAGIGVVWRRSYGLTARARVHELEQRQSALTTEAAALDRDIRVATSRAHLAPLVTVRLGMRVPADTQVVILTRDRPTPTAPPVTAP